MQTRAKRPPSVWLLILCVQGFLTASAIPSAQAQSDPPSGCLGLDAATPTEHLDHALSDVNYGSCLTYLSGQQKAVCDAQPKPAPGDVQAGIKQRFCQQLVMLFQDLSVNFRPDATYRKMASDCAASGASIPCNAKADIEKRMRCLVASIVGGSMEGCLPALPPLPGKK
jgi:hypothetical protein